MRKVLFITHDDMSGGSSKSLVDQIRFLRDNKLVDPIVITWKENSLTEYLRKKGIQSFALRFDYTSVWTRNRLFHFVKRMYYRSFYNYFAYRKLKKQLNFSELSLVVSNSSVVDFGAYLHRKQRIPHIWYLREFGDLDFNIISYIRNLPHYIDVNSDGIIAVSKAVAEHWQKRGVEKRIDVVYNGVCNASFSCEGQERGPIVNICMCGRLCPAKGQTLALKSLTLLPKNILKQIHLDFFGMGESEKDLQTFVRLNTLEKNVSFKGYSENLERELDDYEVGLTLSIAEGFGRTTVEYMMHALFVIGTNTGGTPELLQYGKYGLLIEPGAPRQLAEAIVNYCQNRNELQKRALEAPAYVKREFSISKNAKQAYLLYEKHMK
ncbi:Glycosyltransferase involved in cell wall bisynthesis [Fibrobacter sp. UWB8]|uniref:glycosyltransferase family 4 protein n=1 Tax=Fibrobacter sp. UWB8 TaxID=1896207 RepID=UPI00090FCD23|nr:glycosyltransferase family 4 protein [Fibrobacter sp. UWB8]SHG37591.1 Glycosyltransferase involved in cell wall bisynthesis [Fibrobacter sp. UWB8]